MKAAIIGMGVQGAAAKRILETQGIADFTIFDDKLGQLISKFTDNFDVTVISPGIKPYSIPNYPKKYTSETELGLAALPTGAKVIAITGTDGKSTTTALTAAILNAAGHHAIPCGNFGTPISDAVPNAAPNTIFVLEISSYMIDLLPEKPFFDAACILNIAPDHLDRYGSFEKYTAAKQRLRKMTKPDAIFFDQSNAVAAAARFIDPVKAVAEFSLPGTHNASNLSFAIALAGALASLPTDLMPIIKNLRPLEHRMELVPTDDGIKWYNDSKATTVQAVETALSVFDNIILLMGGRDKGLDFAPLAEKINAHAELVLLFGEAREKIHGQLAGIVTVPIKMFDTLKDATVEAYNHAILTIGAADRRGRPTVLLSPGCASFDEFDSFEHRGLAFKRYIKDIK